ncbi:hypothetical protein RAMLITH_03885 [Ramlibacter sp. RBP-2]|uniref:Uncharacterized protein n=1 Tax=Ramlibacter lithotrophicus TaxID=2606681 RepID=A0A7X6DD44_9BURK|nr:hypothetical protein [Ramlibacter lithotrophicus]NKE64950.1 hypothetical protein [Ramlibacter lithotrophicus]
MITRHFLKTFATLLVGLGCAAFGGTAAAQGTPSAKATFAYGMLKTLPACSTTDAAGCGGVGDSGWHSILKQQIKLANQKDLFMNASLQCGIVTDTTVKSLNSTSTSSYDTAEARGTVRVRVKITTPDGSVVYAQPNSGAELAAGPGSGEGIVFCDRIQQLKAKFSGLQCTASLTTGVVTCTTPEELQLILKTLNAAAFNYVAPNLQSGVHIVEVQARNSAATGATGTNGSLASANAFIGMGSVAVESVRMIKGNDGTTLALD